MTRFAKLRELVSMARALEREAERMSANTRGRFDRLTEAREYRLMALYLAGRLSEEDYTAQMVDVYDARTVAAVLAADAEAAEQRAREADAAREELPVCKGEIPW